MARYSGAHKTDERKSKHIFDNEDFRKGHRHVNGGGGGLGSLGVKHFSVVISKEICVLFFP